MPTNSISTPPVGRFAPSPTGRMHLGNLLAAYVSWRSVRSRGGRWILRIEDLDPQRSRLEYARQIEDDLSWLGLDWDEGGVESIGPSAPYSQSLRAHLYADYFELLVSAGLVYPCRCRRADLLASSAPHQSDGRIVYAGTCRPAPEPPFPAAPLGAQAARIFVPDREVSFVDRFCGPQQFNLARDCGDFVVRRADGVFAYQLAVVVDDALMGVTEVVRGRDLLLSAAQQTYLYELLGFPQPEFAHIPLVCNASGLRLSKRDSAMAMDALRSRFSPSSLRDFLSEIYETQLSQPQIFC